MIRGRLHLPPLSGEGDRRTAVEGAFRAAFRLITRPLRAFGPPPPKGEEGRLRAFAIALCALALTAGASEPSERLADPAQEAHARALFREVRCLVCQNESIDDSEAQLAADLRRIVREQVKAGRSDREIRAFLVERYGEFVLLKPPFSAGNAVLWLAPIGILLIGGVLMIGLLRRREPAQGELSQDEEERLKRLLEDD